MATIRTSVQEFLQKIADAIKQDQESKGITASGRSAQSLRIEVSDNGGKLFSEDYLKYQQTGRGPGLPPPIQSIEQWIVSKGIRPENGDVRSFAFAIANKIAKEGTDIFKRSREGLKSIDEYVQGPKDDLRKALLKETRDLIVDQINR